MARHVQWTELRDMLEKAAACEGLTLAQFVELGRSDDLDEPGLRDLWLIWGEELAAQGGRLAVPVG